ncbi:MAG: HD-GYP domain-containing protein [Nitrospirae bacterium]|nr:MAG: HD-GYP domain-containing protein [Nitrospirota bacterium]
MYLVGIDQPWFKTPFLLHRFRIKSEEEILSLKKCGVRLVKIDLSRSEIDRLSEIGEDAHHVRVGVVEAERAADAVSDASPNSVDALPGEGDSSASLPRHSGSTRYLSVSSVPGADSERAKHASESVEQSIATMQEKPSPSPAIRREPVTANGVAPEEAEHAKIVFHEIASSVEDVFAGVSAGERINTGEAKRVVSTVIAEILSAPKPLLHHIQMQALRRYDPTLFVHSLNVCVMALIVGHQEGFSHETLQTLGLGALLHDVGHLRVPRNLLRKKSGYTKQEQKILHKHPELGASLLAQSTELSPESRRIVAEHHERIDGSGYPHGLARQVISPLSQIVSVVDHYDTAINGRRGHIPLPPAHAVRELYKLCQAGAFNRQWVDRLIRVVGIYPVGSLVELNTGERAIVVADNPLARTKPMVTIIADPVQHAHFLIDLALPNAKPVREICRILDPVQEGIRIQDYLAF